MGAVATAHAPRTVLRGYVLMGEKDQSISHGHIKKLVKKLDNAGIQCKLESLPEAALDYTPRLRRGNLAGA